MREAIDLLEEVRSHEGSAIDSLPQLSQYGADVEPADNLRQSVQGKESSYKME